MMRRKVHSAFRSRRLSRLLWEKRDAMTTSRLCCCNSTLNCFAFSFALMVQLNVDRFQVVRSLIKLYESYGFYLPRFDLTSFLIEITARRSAAMRWWFRGSAWKLDTANDFHMSKRMTDKATHAKQARLLAAFRRFSVSNNHAWYPHLHAFHAREMLGSPNKMIRDKAYTLDGQLLSGCR